MRKGLFILFLCMFTLHGQKIDLINQTKSSCTAGYVFYGGTSGRVACDGGITWTVASQTLLTQKLLVYDTLGTGISSVIVRLGASQASNVPFYILNNAGTATISGLNASGAVFTTLQQGHNYYNLAADPVKWITFLANIETGANAGSDFYMASYSDAGVFLGYPFWIKRSTGVATFSQTIAGSVTGNAATATALAANPTDCGAGAWAISIDASGNLTCTTPPLDQIGNLAANKTFNNADKSISFNFTNPTNQPTYDGAFEIQASGAFAGDLLHVHQHTGNPGTSHLAHFEASDADVIPLHITGPTNDGSTLLADLADSDGATVFSVDSNGNIIAPTLSGNASTSTALAADPTDCAAGQFANAIAANGNLTCAVASAGYRASLTNSAVQSLNNDAATALTFDTEVEDVGGMHDSGTNPSRITIPAGGDGVYLLVCSVGYAAHATGFRQATMYLGGATVLTNNTYEAVSTAGKITVVQSSTYKSLVATNYVECYGQQNSGGALNTNNSAWNTFFQVVKLN